jgi:hypothetical protein
MKDCLLWETPNLRLFNNKEKPQKVVAHARSNACVALWPEILNIVYRNGPKASLHRDILSGGKGRRVTHISHTKKIYHPYKKPT